MKEEKFPLDIVCVSEVQMPSVETELNAIKNKLASYVDSKISVIRDRFAAQRSTLQDNYKREMTELGKQERVAVTQMLDELYHRAKRETPPPPPAKKKSGWLLY